MPKHPPSTKISSFKGLNNVLKPENTTQDYLKKALNVNIDKAGKISKRKGYSLVDTGLYTSLWSNDSGTLCYAIKDGDLVKVNPDYTTTVLKAGVGSYEVSFEEVEGKVYYTSLSHNGIIENDIVRSWGLQIPASPTLSVGIGSLTAGTYQVVYTYVDADGLESGARTASFIVLADGQGVTLTIPTTSDTRVVKSNVYCSTPNGTVLYYYTTTTPGSTVTVSTTTNMSNPFRLFNQDAAPLGSIVRYYRGRLYISNGSTLWFSEPFQYEHFKLGMSYVELPDIIVEVMPVEDGIWIGSDNVYYLSGTSPEAFKLTLKERVQVVSGTSKTFSGSYILLDNTPIGYKWLVTTNLGIFVLFNQGVIINLTATNLSLDRGDKGTSIFLQDEGTNQYLSVIKKNDKPNNSVIGDIVTTSVIRNGITIN